MKDYLLAALLITTSPAVTETRTPTADEWVVLKKSLQDVAVEWQLIDPRETRYIFTDPECYSADLHMVRLRHQDLKDAPRAEDSVRFPEREMVNEWIKFNRVFRKKIDERMQLESDRQAIYVQVIKETDDLYVVWDLVRDARCEFYYVQVRRQALKKLREKVGQEAYDTVDLPPIAPFWRFNELP